MKISKRNFAFGIVIVLAVTVLLILTVCAACNDGEDTKNEMTIPETSNPSLQSEKIEAIPPLETSDIPETEPEYIIDEADVIAIAKTLYRECRGVESDMEKSAVAWCILNRVDSPYFPDTVLGVLEQPYQFAYDENAPVWDSLKQLAEDVMIRWYREKAGDINVGRTLPKEYMYFIGDGNHNYFTVEFLGECYWEWCLGTPYED